MKKADILNMKSIAYYSGFVRLHGYKVPMNECIRMEAQHNVYN